MIPSKLNIHVKNRTIHMDIFLYAHAERTKLRALYPLGRSALFLSSDRNPYLVTHISMREK